MIEIEKKFLDISLFFAFKGNVDMSMWTKMCNQKVKR
jgi:hypothetical protein